MRGGARGRLRSGAVGAEMGCALGRRQVRTPQFRKVFCHPKFFMGSNGMSAMKRFHESEFNTPQEMLLRASFILCLAAFAAGILLIVGGMVTRSLALLGFGLAALGVAGGVREWLRRNNRLDSVQLAIDEIAADAPVLDPARTAELATLLNEWEAMEAKRGSPDFDPWTLQALRNDIRAAVEKDPALENLFREIQRRAA
jgi:hypothetical protein